MTPRPGAPATSARRPRSHSAALGCRPRPAAARPAASAGYGGRRLAVVPLAGPAAQPASGSARPLAACTQRDAVLARRLAHQDRHSVTVRQLALPLAWPCLGPGSPGGVAVQAGAALLRSLTARGRLSSPAALSHGLAYSRRLNALAFLAGPADARLGGRLTPSGNLGPDGPARAADCAIPSDCN